MVCIGIFLLKIWIWAFVSEVIDVYMLLKSERRILYKKMKKNEEKATGREKESG